MTDVTEAAGAIPKLGRVSRRGRLTRRLWRDPLVVVGLLVLAFFLLGALAAPILAPFDPAAVHPVDRLMGPTREYLLGTDALGRDILSRLLFGSRWTLGLAAVATAAVMVIGVSAGAVAGYHGGWLDQAIMRIVDTLMAFPNLILALAIAGALGPGIHSVFIGLVAVWWVDYARIVRSLVLSLRESAFIEGTRALGASNMRVMLRHVIPNVVPPLMVLATLELGTLMLALAGLNFLGLGIQPPTPEWGAMVNDARPHLTSAPHLMLFPGLAITLAVMGTNLLGDGLRDVFDPHLSRRKRGLAKLSVVARPGRTRCAPGASRRHLTLDLLTTQDREGSPGLGGLWGWRCSRRESPGPFCRPAALRVDLR